jgi:hypothetical protein
VKKLNSKKERSKNMKYKKLLEKLLPTQWETRREIRKQMERKGRTLDEGPKEVGAAFADSKTHPDVFHQLYVMPLIEEGVPVDVVLELILNGLLQPN